MDVLTQIATWLKGICIGVGMALAIMGALKMTESKGSRDEDGSIRGQWRIVQGALLIAVGVSPIIDNIFNQLQFGN